MKASGSLLCEGIIDGQDGINGYNAVAVPMYRRSATALGNGDKPTGTLTYTFSTGRVTGASSYFNGWSQTMPEVVAGTKLYVIMALARSQSDTDEIAKTDWSTPVEYVADGMNSAAVTVYKRAASVPNDKPADNAVYTFATGILTGTLNGWSTDIPATDSNHYPCWVRHAMAVSTGSNDTILAEEWSNPATKLVEDGAKGDPGGNTATIFLYRRSATAVTSVGTLPTLYYKFSSKRLYTDEACTTLFSGSGGWYQDIPSGTNQIYVTTAVAYSTTNVDTIGNTEWVTPVQFTENGEHGVNTAPIFLYKRSASAITAHGITKSLYYKFADGVLYKEAAATNVATDSDLNSWSRFVPSGNDPCYIIQASALSQSDTDEIAKTDWSTPVKYVESGTSPWIADGNNEMDSVATNLSGVVTSPKTIYDTIKLFHGATEETFTFQTIKRNGTTLSWDGNNNNVWPRTSGNVLSIEYDTNATFSGEKDEYEITIQSSSDASITRTVRLVVNGIRPGATGEAATLYNLVPSVSEIIHKKDNTFSPATMSCYCTSLNNGTGTDNPSEATMQYSYNDSDWSNFSSSTSFSASTINTNGGKLYLRLLVNNKVMDKETIPIVSDGDKGDNAVNYRISLAGSSFYRDPNSDTIYVNIKGKVYKVNGGSTSAYTDLDRSQLSMYFQKTDGTTDPVPNINSLTDGYTVSGSTFASKYYNNTGYSDEEVFVVVLSVGGSEVARESVQIETYGRNGSSIKGDPGRMYYLAGEFPKNAPYTRTSALCPVVYYGTEWWYLIANSATSSDVPSDSSAKWAKLENYGAVITDAIFVKQFAQFGSAIITGDWLISCHGKINGTDYGGTVENPDNYDGRAAYTYFDPAYPEGYDPFTLPVIEEEISTEYTEAWTKITNNFKLTAGTYKFKVRCYVNASDTLHVRLFQGNDTQDAYYISGTTSEDVVTLEKTITLGSSRSDWNLRAATNEDGELGYIQSVEIEPIDVRFVPNYAVDLRTGRTYQSDAHIKGTITSIGENTKVVLEDGVMSFFGLKPFPNIVLGVDEDGCAILNFYDKNGVFKYGLGPNEIIKTKSQSESLTLKYYNIDTDATDCTSLFDSDIVIIYRFAYKNYQPDYSTCLYKYLAKISANVYSGYYVGDDDAKGKKFDQKIIKHGYSVPFVDNNIYSGGLVMSSNKPLCGIIKYKSSMLSGTSIDELDYRGYDIMQDSDFNRVQDGQVWRFYTKGYSSTEAFYWDLSYFGAVGYNGSYNNKWYLNLCTDYADDDTLIDPIYYFNLLCIDSNGRSLGVKTLYLNKSKLQAILVAAGYNL